MNEKKQSQETKKFKISIYCKIYAENYEIFDGEYSGDEIYEHLMRDANCCVNEEGIRIPGDKNIWYLCSNEKHGYLYFKGSSSPYADEWAAGDSSYKIIRKFVDTLLAEEVITEQQYFNLNKEIQIGKLLGDMYQIPAYLKTISENKKWIPKITNTRTEMKKFHQKTKEHLESKGFKVFQ